MSVSALNVGLSSLNSYQRALDSASHNIANASTAGFQPQQVNFQEAPAGGVRVTINKPNNQVSANSALATTTEPSGTELATELVNSIQYQLGLALSAKIVQTADETLGSLIDIHA